MTQVNMLEAKSNLSKLIKLLETKQEDEIIIARDGNPVAKLTYYERPIRRIGIAKGKYNSMSQEEFDSVNKEIWGDLY